MEQPTRAYLLFEEGGLCASSGEYSMRPKCIVLAESPAQAASRCLGEYLESEDIVHFPSSIFAPTTEDNEFFPAGELLEFRHDLLYLTMLPDHDGVNLHIRELPLLVAITQVDCRQ